MDWRILGLFPVARADGGDVARSAAGRAAAEAIWVPTALLPRFGVTWSASDEQTITAAYVLDDVEVGLHLTLGSDDLPASLTFDRWGDPDGSGTWAQHRFGFEVDHHATFDGITIPGVGTAGWHFGSPRWPEGRFFRTEITNHELLGLDKQRSASR